MKGSFQVNAIILCLKLDGTFEIDGDLPLLEKISLRYFCLQRFANIHQ
jgi:hypothetical protein